MEHDTVIAIVDDTIENIKLLRQLLTSASYKVLCFSGAKAALKAFEKRRPDLILLDVNMPEMSGHECCVELKKTKALADIPVIFISASNDSGDIVKGFEVGGADYIVKPFRVEEVLARVKAHISNFVLQRSLRLSYQRTMELEKIRDDMVHMLVHDIRSPLSAIRGYVELCERRIDRGGLPTAENFDRMKSGASRIGAMLDNILTVSKSEKAGLEVSAGIFDLGKDAVTIVEDFRVSSPDHEITASLSDVKVCALGDRKLTHRVIENLMQNALKFTPVGKGVNLVVELEKCNTVRVLVDDQGPGIRDQDKVKIFDKYQQISLSTNRYKGSVGLGLTFCKLAIEAQGGSIGVNDSSSGGSCFWFSLPCRSMAET